MSTIAQKLAAAVPDVVKLYWECEQESDSAEYDESGKVFNFSDGSRIRITFDRAEVLS